MCKINNNFIYLTKFKLLNNNNSKVIHNLNYKIQLKNKDKNDISTIHISYNLLLDFY